jgi:hypothetical protein
LGILRFIPKWYSALTDGWELQDRHYYLLVLKSNESNAEDSFAEYRSLDLAALGTHAPLEDAEGTRAENRDV